MPYLCMSRADIANGVLQVLDLWPNVSQRNAIYDPPGQTKYVNRCQNDTVAVSSNVTVAQYKGLAAYIIDNTADGVTTNCLTAAIANDCATEILAVLDAGGALEEADITTALVAGGAGAGTTIVGAGGAGVSSGSIAGLLKVLAGGEYVLPAGTAANSGAALKAAPVGSFTTGTYRVTYDTGALKISFGEGQLASFCDANYSYDGVTGAAIVVYNNDGTVYVG